MSILLCYCFAVVLSPTQISNVIGSLPYDKLAYAAIFTPIHNSLLADFEFRSAYRFGICFDKFFFNDFNVSSYIYIY